MHTNTQQTKETIVRQVTFPVDLFRLIEIRIGRLGISIPEYLRHLAINDVEDLVPMVDAETERDIGEALEDYKNGRTKRFDTPEEMRSYFEKLAREK